MTCFKLKTYLSSQIAEIYAVLNIGLVALLLSACGSSGVRYLPPPSSKPQPSDLELSTIPDAVPRQEPRSRYGNPPTYEQFGRRYWTLDSSEDFADQGIASWYGKKFHGKRTSSGETYDMYEMTAAHKTLPLPSYVKVTNLQNGKKIIVRVNDRGPFHQNRIIDLSYVAALKLDIVGAGTGMVEVRAIDSANHQGINNPRPDNSELAMQQAPPEPMVEVQPQPVTDRDNYQVVESHFEPEVAVTTAAQRTITNVPQSGPSFASAMQKNQSNQSLRQKLFVQLGAFSDKNNAIRLRDETQQAINRAVFVFAEGIQEQVLYKVRIGPVSDVDTSDRIVQDLEKLGINDHRIVFQ